MNGKQPPKHRASSGFRLAVSWIKKMMETPLVRRAARTILKIVPEIAKLLSDHQCITVISFVVVIIEELINWLKRSETRSDD